MSLNDHDFTIQMFALIVAAGLGIVVGGKFLDRRGWPTWRVWSAIFAWTALFAVVIGAVAHY